MLDLGEGEVIVRKVSPGVRLGADQLTVDTNAAVAFDSIPDGAVAALVQPTGGDSIRFRKSGDTDPPTSTAGIVIENHQLFPIVGDLASARFCADLSGGDGQILEVEFYGESEPEA
jgi:hypothetical protein